MNKLLDGLNSAQREAVLNTEGAALVIAGAGAGKTRVLTYRIANLIAKKVPAYTILALTFTNKAAREMKMRIGELVGEEQSRQLWMGTFHSIFAKILRYESDMLGYPSAYSIYDTDDTKSLLKSIIRELQLDEKIYKPGEVYARISSSKNNLITPQAYYNNEKIREKDLITRKPMMAEIFKIYASRCKKAGAMDFDDLLLNTNILFRDFPDVLRKYQKKFRYILVDEYQDTNYSQYLIIKKLTEQNKNVCVVGDDAQSIYSFRGAKIENILSFKNDYPDYNLYKLEQNYRSTRNIVNAANSIIDKNEGQIRKTVFSENEEGDRIQVVKALTDVEEGFIVSNSIIDTMNMERLKYSEFAILYRTNAQSRIFEEAMRKRNIPYKIYGSISFYQRKEIKDLIAYLRLLVNPADDEALKRIINYPARGIGHTTLGKLEEAANQRDVSIWQVIEQLGTYPLNLNKGTVTKIAGFFELIRSFRQTVATSDAYEIAINMASANGMLKELHNGNTPEERSKYENLEELLNGIRDFVESAREEGEAVTLDHYLENISLLTDADNEKPEDFNKVSIMTIHSAKGLEFSHVYIAGVEEELFPSRMSMDSMRDLEEERRLFYVAVTRAKKKVTVSYAQTRYKWGTPENCQPSRFISDIAEDFIDWPENPKNRMTASFTGHDLWSESPSFRRRQPSMPEINNLTKRTGMPAGQSLNRATTINDPNFKPSDPALIRTGMMVEHQRFGKGKVIFIDGEMPNKKATVFFQQIKQEKQLLLKFAKLRIVDTL